MAAISVPHMYICIYVYNYIPLSNLPVWSEYLLLNIHYRRIISIFRNSRTIKLIFVIPVNVYYINKIKPCARAVVMCINNTVDFLRIIILGKLPIIPNEYRYKIYCISRIPGDYLIAIQRFSRGILFNL